MKYIQSTLRKILLASVYVVIVCACGYSLRSWGSYRFRKNEHENIDKVILQMNSPLEAISSIPYALIPGKWTLRLPLNVLAISSFALWTRWSPLVGFIDVTSMHWAIISTALSIIPTSCSCFMSRYMTFINACFVIYILCVILFQLEEKICMFYDTHLYVSIGILLFAMSIVIFPIYFKSRQFILGCSLFFLGFLFKILDIQFILKNGTAIFHLLTALGMYIITYNDQLCFESSITSKNRDIVTEQQLGTNDNTNIIDNVL